MKQIFTFFLLFAFFNCCSQNPPLSKSEFTKVVLDSLNNNNSGKSYLKISDLEIRSSEQEKIFLDNLYKMYILTPDSVNILIDDLKSGIFSNVPLKNEIKTNRVVPVVKPLEFLEQLSENGMNSDEFPYYKKYNKELIIVFAEDSETRVRYLKFQELQTLSIPEDSLLNFALENLGSILPTTQLIQLTDKNTFGVMAGAVYENSLILSKKIWNHENFPVDGQFVIGIPNRDILMITGSNNKDEVEMLMEKTKIMYLQHSYKVSPYLFIWNGEYFVKYE